MESLLWYNQIGNLTLKAAINVKVNLHLPALFWSDFEHIRKVESMAITGWGWPASTGPIILESWHLLAIGFKCIFPQREKRLYWQNEISGRRKISFKSKWLRIALLAEYKSYRKYQKGTIGLWYSWCSSHWISKDTHIHTHEKEQRRTKNRKRKRNRNSKGTEASGVHNALMMYMTDYHGNTSII